MIAFICQDGNLCCPASLEGCLFVDDELLTIRINNLKKKKMLNIIFYQNDADIE